MAGRGPQGADRRGPQLRAYRRDHASAATCSWLSADPARRQGYLTDAPSYTATVGTDYEANYARLSALADVVPATSFAMTVRRQGRAILPSPMHVPRPARTRLGQRTPYLVPVDSSTDLRRQLYEVTSPFLPRRHTAASFPQDWASPPTLPRRNAGSVRRP